MAIQVSGTQVIGNSRELTNIASIDATTAAAIGAGGVGAPTGELWLGGQAVGEIAGTPAFNMTFANGRFMMCRNYGGVYWSTDGLNWNVGTYGSPYQKILDVAYISGNTWLAVGDTGTILRSTNNGTNWSQLSDPTGGGFISGVASNGSRTVISVLASGGLRYSDNSGTSWTQVSGTSGWGFDSIGYGNSRFMAVRRSAGFSYSDNGSSFTNVSNSVVSGGTNFESSGPTYGDSRWMYGLSGGNILTSTNNGVSWTAVESGGNKHLRKCWFANGSWIMVGDGCTLLKSASGTPHFVQIPPPFGTNIIYSGVAYGNGRWAFNIYDAPGVASAA
tara:strand:- start:295 stop:1290 length:996 start_codon:yes stop_codon:yes gene_type:complete